MKILKAARHRLRLKVSRSVETYDARVKKMGILKRLAAIPTPRVFEDQGCVFIEWQGGSGELAKFPHGRIEGT